MKPSSWDKPLGLASPRESAASQSDQTNNPSKNEVRNEVGLDVSTPHPHLPEGRGEVFSLTSLFIGRVKWRCYVIYGKGLRFARHFSTEPPSSDIKTPD